MRVLTCSYMQLSMCLPTQVVAELVRLASVQPPELISDAGKQFTNGTPKPSEGRFYACDTEVAFIDVKEESPVGAVARITCCCQPMWLIQVPVKPFRAWAQRVSFNAQCVDLCSQCWAAGSSRVLGTAVLRLVGPAPCPHLPLVPSRCKLCCSPCA